MIDNPKWEPSVVALSDSILLDAVRVGRSGAYGELVRRNRKPVFHAAATYYFRFAEPEDLVAEVFVRLWFILRQGGGPRRRLRPYLLALMRVLAMSRWFHETCGDDGVLGPHARLGTNRRRQRDVTAEYVAVRAGKLDAVRAAFRGLRERDRELLVALDVDGAAPAAVAERMGLSANAVSALAGRARKRLHDAYVRARDPEVCAARCQSTHHVLSACIHGTASLGRVRLFAAHLVECASCRVVVGGLIGVQHELAVAGSVTRWMSGHGRMTDAGDLREVP